MCRRPRIKPAPLRVGFRIGQDGASERDQIKIERAHPPALFALAAKVILVPNDVIFPEVRTHLGLDDFKWFLACWP